MPSAKGALVRLIYQPLGAKNGLDSVLINVGPALDPTC
jgi:hypothetical protein